MPNHIGYQYASTSRLDARIAIHCCGANPQPWHLWLADRLPLRAEDDLIEVGAGTGALWHLVAIRPASLTLTDASAAMCKRLAEVPGAIVRQCSAQALPYPDRTFDGVIANHMLYHLDDLPAGLAELHRVLRPGGWLSAATNGAGHMTELAEAARLAGVPDAAPTQKWTYTAETAAGCRAGLFTDVQLLSYEDALTVPDADMVVAYQASCAGRELTDGELAELRSVAQDVIDATGAFHINKHTVLVLATRP